MTIAVTGSIATDQLMTFSGKFADSLIADQLDKISLSYLVDDLEIRRGGCAANIAFGLGQFGHRPVLVGAVGKDFDDLGYRDWLTDHGVDCAGLLVSEKSYTARFVCTTDSAMAQLSSFYTGAMAEAREIDLLPIAEATGGFELVVISPNDPEAMVRHTAECRAAGIPFAADPSQQLAWAGGEMIRELIDGATYLFSNDYEELLIEQKTGWSASDLQERVQTRIVTHGANGAHIYTRDAEPVVVPAVPGVDTVDPTGVGDSFRAGFLAAVEAGLGHERSTQVGCALAAGVIETVGTQEYTFRRDPFLTRFRGAYGDGATSDIADSRLFA